MKQAKQKRYSFHPRIGRGKRRKSVVTMYTGVNLKHQPVGDNLEWVPCGRDLCAMYLGIDLNGPSVWRSDLEMLAQLPSDAEVSAMLSRTRSTVPIVCHVGVLTDSQDDIRSTKISLTSPYENC